MSPEDLEKVLTGGREVASRVVRRFWPQAIYAADISPRLYGNGNRLVVSVDDLYVGDVLDSPFFKEHEDKYGKWSDAKKGIAHEFEHSTQQTLKALGPRKYSRLHQYSHITRNAQIAFEIAKKAGVPLDFVILLTIIGHENIEDHEEVRDLLNQWKTAVTNFDSQKRLVLEDRLKAKRAELKVKLYDELLGYLEHTSVKGAQRRSLERDLKFVTNIIYDETRFSDVVPYPFSMSHVYSRDGVELPLNMWRRFFGKNVDRISGLLESGPLISRPAMKRLKDAFGEDGEVGRELRQRYGDIGNFAVEMSPALKVRNAFKSLFPLHYQNGTFTQYENDASVEGRTAQVLELARYSKIALIEATSRSLDNVIKIYEGERAIRDFKSSIDGEIEINKRGNFYDGITADEDAFIVRLVGYDAGGSVVVKARDKTLGGRVDTYRVARNLREQIHRFGMVRIDGNPNLVPVQNFYGSGGRSNYRHFAVEGVDEALEPIRGDKFWELVGRLRSKAQKPAANAGNMLWIF